jgi:PAS domain S-box-containing protein
MGDTGRAMTPEWPVPELLAHVHDAVLLLDTEARVLEANAEACRSLGYARASLVGKSCSELVEGFDAAMFAALRAHMIEHGVASLRATHRRSDGSRFPVETRLTLIRREGPTVILVLFRDLTEEFSERHRAEEARAALEERVRQSEKLEALGTLAGGVAHDFNNVLAVILGHADALAQTLSPGSVGRNDAEQIATAARRARGVVQQILAFARRRPHEAGPVDVPRAVREELPLVRAATPADVDVRVRSDDDAGTVLADPTQIHQLLLNLCSNARDAMAERGGVLEVTVERAEVPGPRAPAGLAAGSYVRLSVADTGAGMDAPTRARAFEPYFTTKPVGIGSGLGLAVVHGIATGLRGAVTLDSAPGQGTRVEVWLPRLAPPDQPALPGPYPVSSAHGRILLVDDDPLVARAIGRMLELVGYDVTTYGDAETALARFRADPEAFDVLLSDQTLPRMRGDELARAALALRPGLPVILCTGYSERIDEEAARELGARALLAKPLDMRELSAALRDALASAPDRGASRG